MSLKYRVTFPSNHNDYIETFTSFPEAVKAAKQGYGDVEVVLHVVLDNVVQDISTDLQQLLKEHSCH